MKVLMVGLGAIGQRHLRNLVTVLGDQVEFIAYRTRSLPMVLTDRMQVEPGADLETKHKIQSFLNLDEALARKPEVAFICNPSSLHIPAATRAAQAGCHLFIEKPLSDSLDGVPELVDLVREKRLVGYVGYQLRFHPCLKKVHSLLNQKAIGRVMAVRVEVGEYLPGWHAYEDYRQSYAARKDLGGGTLLSQIHEMDYLYWFFGLPQRIFTLGGHLSRLEVDVEDLTSTLMETQVDGRLIPIHLQQDYVQRPPVRTCQIVGDGGKIQLDLAALTVRWYDSEGRLAEEVAFPDFQRNQLFIDQMNHFLSCVRGEETPLVGISDGAQSLRMALAAKESLESGRIVGLPVPIDPRQGAPLRAAGGASR
jgi:predicted dehydrogenase